MVEELGMEVESRRGKATFNLEPEYIDASPLGPFQEELVLEELTEAQLRELKESSHKRVKRIVAGVGITLTLISILLVALSLTLGQKIDDLVGQRVKDSAAAKSGQVGDGDSFYIGPPTSSTPPPKPTTSDGSAS